MAKRTMREVSHTAPNGASAGRVWERGNEKLDVRTDGGEDDE